MENVLTIRNLSKSFGKIQAVNDVSFTVPPKSVFGILGPNGSGKTTTLGIVLDVVKQDHGDFLWFGNPISGETKRRIGAILETPNFYPYLSARRNLQIVADIKGVPYSNIAPVLDRVGLLGRQNSKFQEYSLGMKQRLAIGSCLLGDPDVLVLDEPTNGLDPEGINQVRELIKGIAEEGKTIILASHLLDEVEKVCDHVAILKSGIMMRCGSVEEILTDDTTFEVSAAELGRLKSVIDAQNDMKIISEKNGRLLIQSKDESFTAEKLNALLYSNGVTLNHLTEKKKSLEDSFLQIVKGR